MAKDRVREQRDRRRHELFVMRADASSIAPLTQPGASASAATWIS
jgi:hypothetical protein